MDPNPRRQTVLQENGTEMRFVNGELHSENGQPAVFHVTRSEWYENGVRHRGGDLPAVVRGNGTMEWWVHGVRHRDGGYPAFDNPMNGTQLWYFHGVLHREGDQPAVVRRDGTRMWYRMGVRHRDGDQPAVMRPHVVRPRDGRRNSYVEYFVEYWVNGVEVYQDEP